MLTRSEIAQLIPHQGGMCLLDRVVEWNDSRIVLVTGTHRSVDNPLRSAGGLRALHLCEYAAQAVAVHGGLSVMALGKEAPPGLLVALRDVLLTTDYVDNLPGELVVTAVRLLGAAASSQYSFHVTHEGRQLASGRVTIMVRAA